MADKGCSSRFHRCLDLKVGLRDARRIGDTIVEEESSSGADSTYSSL